MDTFETIEPVLGPKCKCEETEPHIVILTDKKQKRLDEETKALGKLTADNLGLAVAAIQHHRTQ